MSTQQRPLWVVLMIPGVLGLIAILVFSVTREFLQGDGHFSSRSPTVSRPGGSAGIIPPSKGGEGGEAVFVPTSTLPEAPAIVPSGSATATMLFVGDIMLDRNVRTRSLKAGTRAYPFQKLPENWFDQADYAVANLEGPVTAQRRPPEKSIDFQFEPVVIDALAATGIDAFSQANNHALDQGNAGYQDSTAALRAAGFLVFGHQVQDGDISFATTTVNGIKIALMGWNTTDNPMDRADASAAIQRAQAQADIVIAYLHWGPEYQDRPARAEVETAHWLVDRGLDAVIGGHPHWVQGMSLYKGKPIVWSLGNFVFDQDFSVETKQGMAVKLDVNANGILSLQPIPLQIIASQPSPVLGADLQTRLDRLAEISDEPLRTAIKQGFVPIAPAN